MLDESDQSRRMVDAAIGASLFLRRATLNDVGPFDESFFLYWQETDWLVKAARQGSHTLYLPSVQAVHIGRRSTDLPRETLSATPPESQHVYARKHFGRAVAMALRDALATIDLFRWARPVAWWRRPPGSDGPPDSRPRDGSGSRRGRAADPCLNPSHVRFQRNGGNGGLGRRTVERLGA
jgi:N-acetylglucosaminyl-diphospho-decaprenol L-rhamnosyltransferase